MALVVYPFAHTVLYTSLPDMLCTLAGLLHDRPASPQRNLSPLCARTDSLVTTRGKYFQINLALACIQRKRTQCMYALAFVFTVETKGMIWHAAVRGVLCLLALTPTTLYLLHWCIYWTCKKNLGRRGSLLSQRWHGPSSLAIHESSGEQQSTCSAMASVCLSKTWAWRGWYPFLARTAPQRNTSNTLQYSTSAPKSSD